jgi:3-mercaptopyruvate sulfurtransferase SseA
VDFGVELLDWLGTGTVVVLMGGWVFWFIEKKECAEKKRRMEKEEEKRWGEFRVAGVVVVAEMVNDGWV